MYTIMICFTYVMLILSTIFQTITIRAPKVTRGGLKKAQGNPKASQTEDDSSTKEGGSCNENPPINRTSSRLG
jgi:hypothetical protein